MGHQSPAKILRNVKRITNFIRRKSLSTSSSTQALAILKPVHTDVPPYSSEEKQELLMKIENHQLVLTQVKEAFTEMLKVKDEHIDFLKVELANLPAIIMRNIQAQLRPPER